MTAILLVDENRCASCGNEWRSCALLFRTGRSSYSYCFTEDMWESIRKDPSIVQGYTISKCLFPCCYRCVTLGLGQGWSTTHVPGNPNITDTDHDELDLPLVVDSSRVPYERSWDGPGPRAVGGTLNPIGTGRGKKSKTSKGRSTASLDLDAVMDDISAEVAQSTTPAPQPVVEHTSNPVPDSEPALPPISIPRIRPPNR